MIIMIKNLKQRLGTGIVLAAAGIGSLVGLGGCESYSEYDWMALSAQGYGTMAKTPEQATALGLASQHFDTQANRHDRRIVADKNNLYNFPGDVILLDCGYIYYNCNILGWDYSRLKVKESNGDILSIYRGEIKTIIDRDDKGSDKRFR